MAAEILQFPTRPPVNQSEPPVTSPSHGEPPISLGPKIQQKTLTNAYVAYQERERRLLSAHPEITPVSNGADPLPSNVIRMSAAEPEAVPALEVFVHDGFGLTQAEKEASDRQRKALWREPNAANPDPDYDC